MKKGRKEYVVLYKPTQRDLCLSITPMKDRKDGKARKGKEGEEREGEGREGERWW
jgi:hypothetical protein